MTTTTGGVADATEPPAGGYRMLSIGVTGFAGPFAALPQAGDWAAALRVELGRLGYASGDPVAAPLTSKTIGEAVYREIEAAGPEGVLVVHVVTHGNVVEQNDTLYVVGSDGATHPLADVEHWLKAVQDGTPRPLVLFVLDICQSGTAARLPWQNATADGSARAWVIAACGPQEQAFNGWLTRATTTVLRQLGDGDLDIDPGVEFVPLRLVGRKVRAEVARLAEETDDGDGLRQQVTGSQLDFLADTPELRFFKNPAFAPKRPVALSPETDAALASFTDGIREPTPRSTAAGTRPSGPNVPDLRAPGPGTSGVGPVARPASPATRRTDREPLPDPGLSREHWEDRAAGFGPIPRTLDSGCFTGRLDQLNELVPWLQGWAAGSNTRTLSVVTGGPGVGKSALLGVVVCAAHPALRNATKRLWSEARQTPPEIRQLVAVHARQRDLADVTASLARQLTSVLAPATPLVPADPAGLVAVLKAATVPQPVPVVVLDALDESSGEQAIIDELIVPLVEARRADATPACRVLVGTRRDGSGRLLDVAAAQHGLIDLDEVDQAKLLEDLNGYVVKLLRTQPAYRTVAGARGAFAEEVAAALARQPDGDGRWGEFLISGLYTHSFLRANAAAPITSADEAGRRGARCPRTLPEVLELDLKDRPNEGELRQVLQIVSLARGAGIPASVIDRCRPRQPGFGPWTPTLDAVSQLGFYLRRASDEDGTALYRIFHEGLADQLRPRDDPAEDDDELLLRVWSTAWEPGWSRKSAEEALVTAMLAPLGPPAARRWDLAEPYVLRHLLDHALLAWTEASPALHQLLLDPGFLVHADPSLSATLQRLPGTPAAQPALRLFDAAKHADPASRRAALALEAARASLRSLAASFAEPPAGSPEPPLRWQPRWTAGDHLPPSLMTSVGPPLWPDMMKVNATFGPPVVTALTVAIIDGEQVVVAAERGKLYLRSLADGRPTAGTSLRYMTQKGEADSLIQAVGVDRDGSVIVAVVDDAVMWRLPVDRFVRADGLNRWMIQSPHVWPDVAWLNDKISDAVWMADSSHGTVAVQVVKLAGRVLVALTGTDQMVTPVDGASGRTLGPMQPYLHVSSLVADGRPFALALGADEMVYEKIRIPVGRYPASRLAVFNPDGSRHGLLTGHTGHITTLTTMTLDGQPVAVTGSLDGTVRFWDVPGLREIERLTLPGPVQTVAPAGDGHLAVLCCGEVIVYARHDPSRPPEPPARPTVVVEITQLHRVPRAEHQETTP